MTLEVLLLGSVATGSHWTLARGHMKKKSNEVSRQVSNEVAKRGQMRDSGVPLSSQA